MNIQLLTRLLQTDEGLRLKPYTCTAGRLTIGYGRNLDDRGISEAEADFLLHNDIVAVQRELARIPVYADLDSTRQTVLANMAFNLGTPRLLTFKRMWVAVGRGLFEVAANEMLDSKWARQVGDRASRLAEIMRTGDAPK